MHPVDYLFEDIYRNYWGISPASGKGPRRAGARPGLFARQSYFRQKSRRG